MKLTDICDFQGGSQPPKNQWSSEPKEGYIRMLQIRDFTQDNSKVEYVKITNSIKKCNGKDILIARYGASIGKILTGLSGAYNVAMMKVVIDENIVDRNFIYNFLKSDMFQNYIKNVGQRAAQAGFNKEELSKININLPTLEEQKNIAQELNKVQEIIDIRKKQIDQLYELIKSQFVEMFGSVKDSKWKKEKLEDITEKITDGKHGGCQSEYNSGYYFIGATEIYNDKINYENSNQITKKDFEKDYTRCDLKLDDFVIVNTGATIGKSAIVVDERCKNTLLQKSVALIRGKKEKILPIYLKYCYEEEPSLYSKGQGCARINLLLSQIRNTDIPVPPIELQNKFAYFVKQIDKQKFKVQESFNKMQNLYEALMNQYFG